jgi:hypothetical protein
MSSRAVRTWFRAFVPTAVPSVPYVETTNQAPDPRNLPALWSTLEFSNASEQRLTLGSRAIFREYGNVEVVVLGLSGKGDSAVMQAAELFRTALTSIALPLPVGAGFGDFKIDAPEPPNTDATESGNWFLASVSCSYTLDVVRGT